MSRLVSFILLVAVIIVIGVVFYRVMADFVVPMFLAALLVVIFRPMHERILRRVNGRPKTAALLTTIAVMFCVLVPLAVVIALAAAEGRELVKRFDGATVMSQVKRVRSNLGLEIPHQDEITAVEELVDELAEQSTRYSSPEFLDLHFRVSESARELNQSLGLTWPTPPSQDSETPREARRSNRTLQGLWEAFIDKQRQIADGLEESRKNRDAEPDAEIPHGESVTKMALELKEDFRDFKIALLGGRTRSALKEIANPTDEQVKAYAERARQFLQSNIVSIGKSSLSFLVRFGFGVLIMIIALYFFLLDGPKMLSAIKALSPLDDRHESELIVEFDRVSRAVVLATLLSAIAQGILAGIGFYFAGLDSIFLLTLLTMVFALVPFIGAASVWVPASIWLILIEQQTLAGVLLAIYGIAVISMADNVIKPFILHGQSNLHPLLALLSVLGGVSTLGPVGILIGPMVVAFLQTLLKILQSELQQLDRTRQTAGESLELSE